MSKAFLREDDVVDEPVVRRWQSPLSRGEKNYLTPAGAHRLREAVAELKHERMLFATPPVSAETRQELREIDQRIRYFEEALWSAEIVPPADKPWNVVQFGATVCVRDSDGEEARYRIVGVDEAELWPDGVSWRSPIGRALLRARVGDHVPVEFPEGRTELEITSVLYE